MIRAYTKYVITLVLFLLCGYSYALVLTPADCNVGVNCWTTDDNSAPHAGDIASMVGSVDDFSLFYKAEVGGGEEGFYRNSYDTVFSNTDTDPEDALITYVGGSVINCSECYLSVKDGNHSPAMYVFDISGWNGMDSIELLGFWPAGGAISHVAIWGPTSLVAEPKTIALLGMGMILLGVLRRRQHACISA